MSTHPCTHARRGSALLTAMLFTMVAAFLGMSYLGMAASDRRLSVRREDRERAFQLAEAGLQHSIAKLAENDAYTGQVNTAFGDGWFRVSVLPRAGEPGRRNVVSTGRIRSLDGAYVERSVRGIVGWTKPHPAWGYTIFSETSMSLADRTVVNSAPTPNDASIHSNGLITLGLAHLHVYGTASAGTAVVALDPSVVTEGIENGAEAADYPPFNGTILEELAEANGITAGSISVNTGTAVLRGKILGNVTIGGSADLTIQGPVWITGNLTISGKSWAGGGSVVAEGKIYIGVSCVANTGGTNDLGLVSLSSAPDAVFIDTKDNSDKINVFGGVFAPNGGVTVHGKSYILGSLIGRTVIVDGKGDGVDVVRNGDFHPSVGVLPEVYHWSEL